MWSMGRGIAVADRIEPVAAIIERLMADTLAACRRLAGLQQRASAVLSTEP